MKPLTATLQAPKATGLNGGADFNKNNFDCLRLILASIVAARWSSLADKSASGEPPGGIVTPPISEVIRRLADPDPALRLQAAYDLFDNGTRRTLNWFNEWRKDEEFRALVRG